jgi:hypothetical protein
MSGRLGLAAGLCKEQTWLAADCLEHEAGVETKLAVAGQVGCAHALAADAALGGTSCRMLKKRRNTQTAAAGTTFRFVH